MLTKCYEGRAALPVVAHLLSTPAAVVMIGHCLFCRISLREHLLSDAMLAPSFARLPTRSLRCSTLHPQHEQIHKIARHWCDTLGHRHQAIATVECNDVFAQESSCVLCACFMLDSAAVQTTRYRALDSLIGASRHAPAAKLILNEGTGTEAENTVHPGASSNTRKCSQYMQASRLQY